MESVRKHRLEKMAHRHKLDVIALLNTFLLEEKRLTIVVYIGYMNDRNRRVAGTAILVKRRIEHYQLLMSTDLQRMEATDIETSITRYG